MLGEMGHLSSSAWPPPGQMENTFIYLSILQMLIFFFLVGLIKKNRSDIISVHMAKQNRPSLVGDIMQHQEWQPSAQADITEC